MLQNLVATKIISCFGLPENLPIVFTEVSHHFSYFNNLALEREAVEPCAIIIKDGEYINSIFKIGCYENNTAFTKKYVDSAELYVDNFEHPQKNWLIKLSLILNQINFQINLNFDVDLKNHSIAITGVSDNIDELSALQLTLLVSSI